MTILCVPTKAQFRTYRANRRQYVRNIVVCVRGGTIALSPWARGVIAKNREEHTASIRRERNLSNDDR